MIFVFSCANPSGLKNSIRTVTICNGSTAVFQGLLTLPLFFFFIVAIGILRGLKRSEKSVDEKPHSFFPNKTYLFFVTRCRTQQHDVSVVDDKQRQLSITSAK
jgi:hypothetical protein